MTKKITWALLICISVLGIHCAGDGSKPNPDASSGEPPKSMIKEAATYDPKRGEGKFSADNVTLGALDAAMATKGEAISSTKCLSCHKLTDERLVGPGWKGVTQRRTPYWLMNFITNPDPMITKDPELQTQLELCLVRMPNQNLTDDDARQVVEFMRKNDGVQ
jgi:mono/diheme cytochrome c family protein